MILEMDNKGARDLICNWSAGGRLRHVDIRQYFLRDLKEDGLIWTRWIPSEAEFTPRATPQHNSLAETGFATLLKRARALLADANVPLELRYKLYTEVIRTAAKLDSLVVIKRQGMEKTRYEIFYQGIKPKWAAHLRTWGEAGVVKLKTLATTKLEDRGVTCMFVGYAEDHSSDCYRMWDPKTNRVHVTRDIIWLRRMFFIKTVFGKDDIIVTLPHPVTNINDGDFRSVVLCWCLHA
jgi:hypothetical protein